MNSIQLGREFSRRVNAFYDEASRYGTYVAYLEAGTVVAKVRDCRPALEDRWAELDELLGGRGLSELHLWLAVVAIRRLVALDRAVLYEQSLPSPEAIADGVDLLA